MKATAPPFPRYQAGAALAVGMILLIVLSLSLVVAFRASVLQERMAGGFRNESLSEAAAESALRAGEQWLWNWIVANPARPLRPGETAFVRGPATVDAAADAFRNNREWLADGAEYGDTSIVSSSYGELAHQPRFQIEVSGEETRINYSSTGGGAGVISGASLVSHTGGGYAGSGGSGGGASGLVLYYRITARGAGGTEGVVRVLESTFTSTR